MKALGLDPGIRGGLAVVEMVDAIAIVVSAIEVPTIGVGAKERVNVAAVHAWLREYKPDVAFIERAQAMPKQGASSGFKYGRAVGSLEATITLCAIPLQIVEPALWKRTFRLPRDKEAARQRALELFPAAQHWFARKKDHGLAEASLIALFGLKSTPAFFSSPRPATSPSSASSSVATERVDRGVTAVSASENEVNYE
jgi:crossover junction endodeoxyribonuclease RuvC